MINKQLAAPLWTAKCTFLTDLGTHHSKFTGETPEVVINRFFGIFFAMFQSSKQIILNKDKKNMK